MTIIGSLFKLLHFEIDIILCTAEKFKFDAFFKKAAN